MLSEIEKIKRDLENRFLEEQHTTCLCDNGGYDFCDYLMDCLATEREKVRQLSDMIKVSNLSDKSIKP